MNGSYSNYYYYDFYPHGDAYPGYGTGTHTNSTSKRAQYGWEGRSESKESKDSDPSVDNDDKEKPFNDDFVSRVRACWSKKLVMFVLFSLGICCWSVTLSGF